MPLVDRNGVTFHTQRLGEAGPPLVMLHGLVVGSLASWYFTSAPPLAKSHRVLLFDLRGHGLSSRPATGYGVRSMAQDLAALLEEFGDEPVRLVGHSFGALVALRFALDHPGRVTKLALVEAPLPPSRLGEVAAFLGRPAAELTSSLPAPLQAALGAGKRQALRFVEQVRALGQTSLPADLEAERDVPDEELGRLDAEVRCFYGTASAVLPVGERLAAVIPGASLRTLPGGHYLPLEAPAELTAGLVEFLDG